MKCIALALLLSASSAFVVAPPRNNRLSPSISRRYSLAEESNESTTKDPAISKPDVSEGTHDELMYALGVNLARQLGDVKPLVNNGEELAQVAKGLLDTVIGRLTDDGQRELLSRRGGELNQLITDRA